MSTDYLNNRINLVHYYMLKHTSFNEIKEKVGLDEQELIDCINQINSTNNQVTPLITKDGNHRIVYQKREFTIHQFEIPKKRYKLMFVSDKHIDHIDDRIEYINNSYEEAEKRNVNLVFDLGDILNGPRCDILNPAKVRTGTLEGSIEQLRKHHPTNKTTYYITGNHDLRFMRSDLCDIGRLIETECKNMKFLNNLFTCIEINGLRINLTHGSIENKPLNLIKLSKNHKLLMYNNPHMICQGHFHKSNCLDNCSPLLYQIPSLKGGGNKSNGRNGISDDIGVVFLTVWELNDELEIVREKLEFVETKRLVKTEIRIKK